MNTLIRPTGLAHKAFALLALSALVIGLVPMQAFAGDADADALDGKVFICHSKTGGYDNGRKEVAIESILNAHSNETTGGADGRGDIIPSFSYTIKGTGQNPDTVGSFPGLNWDTAGKAIFNAGCEALAPVDVCPNITGAQATVPTGYEIVGGQCVLVVVVVDQCPNIDGPQATIPQGMIKNQAGECVIPVVDQCPLVDGVQTDTTLCPPVVDMCPLVDGIQVNTILCPPIVDQCPLVDGVQTDTTLCPPVIDMCPNVPGNQADTTLCPIVPPPATCEVTIGSNTNDFVLEKSANALALSYVHPGWTASIPGATWIWGDNPVVDSATSSTQTFRKQFGFVGTVTSAKLYVAADNSYTSQLNTATSGVSAAENNFQLATQDEYTVTSLIAQGNNELKVAVTNFAGDANPASNPAGLLYKLVIAGTPTTDSDCLTPYVPPVVVNGCTNPLATNYVRNATIRNPQAANCDFNYASQCGENPNLLKNGSFEGPEITSSWALTTITDWVVTKVADNTLVLGEIWRGLSPSSQGAQHVELDSTERATLTQTVTTVPGATYQLRFDLAARSDTAEANNAVLATANATTVVSTVTDNTNWTTYGGTFLAASASTDVALADAGTPSDGLGTLVDNAVLCLVRLPAATCSDRIKNQNETGVDTGGVCANGGPNDVDTYRIEGYVWHDDNESTTRDNIGEEEIEGLLAGWTVNITNGLGDNRSTTTDAFGEYYFEVPAGTWTITEVVQDGWDRTTQESHVVVVPQIEEMTLFDSVVNFIIPTAYAAVLATYDGYNFGNNEAPSNNGGGNGGGGGGNRAGDRNGDVLGISDSPLPLVLGDQVSAVPAGAPNTGKGGSAVIVLGQFLALPRRREV